jgi:polysaccharide pyruvyl transferase WcaK-like protein
MYIELKGVEFSNKGAELMLRTIVQRLDQHFGDYELVLSPGYLSPYKKRARLGAWQKFSFKLLGVDWTALGNLAPKPLRRLLRHFGIVVEKDIDWVLDASGFVYSDKWGPAQLLETLAHLKRIRKHGSRYLFLSQAFGPFENSKNAALMKQLIERADLVIARDDDSLKSLQALANELANELANKSADKLVDNAKIACYPDFTPSLDTTAVSLPLQVPRDFVCIIPNNKMYKHKGAEHKKRYLAFLVEAVQSVEALGLTPLVLNHEGIKDRKLCAELIDLLPHKPQFVEGLDAPQVKKLIGMAVFNLSSRFHGCVSSLSQGIPSLATSWGHKYEQLYRYYECEDDLLDVYLPDSYLQDSCLRDRDQPKAQMQQVMAQLLADRDVRCTALKLRAKEHKQSIDQMWALVFEHMK